MFIISDDVKKTVAATCQLSKSIFFG